MELQVVGPESNWNNESVAHIRSETRLCWTVCPSKHDTSGIFYPQGTASKAVKLNIIIKICKKLKFKLYFPLAEERNKWKMFSHTPLGWAQGVVLSHVLSVVCQLLFCCPSLLTEISEPQFPPNSSFELKTYTLLFRYSLLRLSAWILTKLIYVVSYYCILPRLRIILGWIDIRNKIVSWRRSAWQWLPGVCENLQFVIFWFDSRVFSVKHRISWNYENKGPFK